MLKFGDVRDLASDALIFGEYTAISINGRKKSPCVVLDQTTVSLYTSIVPSFQGK